MENQVMEIFEQNQTIAKKFLGKKYNKKAENICRLLAEDNAIFIACNRINDNKAKVWYRDSSGLYDADKQFSCEIDVSERFELMNEQALDWNTGVTKAIKIAKENNISLDNVVAIVEQQIQDGQMLVQEPVQEPAQEPVQEPVQPINLSPIAKVDNWIAECQEQIEALRKQLYKAIKLQAVQEFVDYITK